MAFKYNNVEPTQIKYDGTDLTKVIYDTTTVWVKPFTLTLSPGANTTITAIRDSSDNPEATTGSSNPLKSGSTIYYNDKIRIYGTATDGYKLENLTVSGTDWGTSTASYIVAGNLTATTTAKQDMSWKRVYSGNGAIEFNQFSSGEFEKSFDGVEGGYETRAFLQIWQGNLNSDGNEWASSSPQYGELQTLPAMINSEANSVKISLNNQGDFLVYQSFNGGSGAYGITKIIVEYARKYWARLGEYPVK